MKYEIKSKIEVSKVQMEKRHGDKGYMNGINYLCCLTRS